MANRVNRRDGGKAAQRGRRDARVTKSGRLLYLYGITDEEVNVRNVQGVDGVSAVEPVPFGDYFCWVSRVDAKEYGDELQSRMENLDWLAGASVRHQKVVGTVYEQNTILPARFATLFVSEQSLTAHIKSHAAELKKDFKRLSGKDEYGVKVFAIPQVAATAATPMSGRDYLRRKAELLRERAPVGVTPAVKKFIAKVREMASQVAEGGTVTSGQRSLVWQGSFLLPRSERKELESALSTFHRQHSEQYRVECTGPWPPYSFVTLKAHA